MERVTSQLQRKQQARAKRIRRDSRAGRPTIPSLTPPLALYSTAQILLDKSTVYIRARWAILAGILCLYAVSPARDRARNFGRPAPNALRILSAPHPERSAFLHAPLLIRSASSARQLRVYLVNGWYIVTYGLGIYLLNLFIGFLSPQIDPETDGLLLPQKNAEEFRPFSRRVPEFKFWLSSAKATTIAFFMTFFRVFDIPVFWPILLLYFIALFVLTMKRQIKHARVLTEYTLRRAPVLRAAARSGGGNASCCAVRPR